MLTHATAFGCSAKSLYLLNLHEVDETSPVCKKGSIKQAIETGLTVLKEYWSTFCISLALQEEKKLSGKQSRFLNFHQLINPCDFEFTSCYWTDFSQGGYKIGIKSAGSFRGDIVILMRLREYSLHGVCFSTLKLPLWSEMLCTDIYC